MQHAQKGIIYSLGILTGFIITVFCITVKAKVENKEIIATTPVFESVVNKPIDYDSMCIIGRKYTLYPPDYKTNKNPFEPSNPAIVRIVTKKDGYVQYCHSVDYGKGGLYLFTKSCKEFIDATKEP